MLHPATPVWVFWALPADAPDRGQRGSDSPVTLGHRFQVLVDQARQSLGFASGGLSLPHQRRGGYTVKDLCSVASR